MVNRLPPGCAFRTRLFAVSATYQLPSASAATPSGRLSSAVRGNTISPLNPATPLPASVVMAPPGATARTRWFCVSEMYTTPDGPTATPDGPLSCAAVADVPSPE